jgi:hypothetical protein
MTPECSKQMVIGKMMEFVNKTPLEGVNRFRLQGEDNQTAYVDSVVGLFQFTKNSTPMHSLYTYLEQPQQHTVLENYSKILHITVPRKYELYPQDEKDQAKFMDNCNRNGLPIAALLFGNVRDPLDNHITASPFVQLCVIRGMSPNDAIKEMQYIARQYIAESN